MSTTTASICRHCGTKAVPTAHRCAAKQTAISEAFSRYTTRRATRPKQVWHSFMGGLAARKGAKLAVPVHAYILARMFCYPCLVGRHHEPSSVCYCWCHKKDS